MTAPGAGASKAQWRAWARERRAEVDYTVISAQIVAALAAWGRLTPASRVLFFDPLPDEPDVTTLAAGVRAFLTRTPREGLLTVHPFDAPREKHPLGFTQPRADAPAIDPGELDVVLVPGLAFDRTGVRLGRGRGLYDRLLARVRPDALVIGVTPAALVVDALPHRPHDHPMTHLVSELGIHPVVESDLTDAARAWIAADPDPVTRAELSSVLESGEVAALTDRMTALDFGTAGIRGEVGAGPGRMNRAVVIRTTRGLADWLVAAGRAGSTVVVGYDGRTDSRRFAEDAVAVLAGAGFDPVWFDAVTPTPLIAFEARRTGAAAAVVVTASHNPPRDNGYKVYDSNGAQIVPPVDTAIGAAIAAVGGADAVPRTAPPPARSPSGAEEAYVEAVLAFRGDRPTPGTVPIVHTALHGVGGASALRLLALGGHIEVTAVAEQAQPDGRFPTVAFPNPEEPGALDLAERLAGRTGAALVLANDPDADRLGVAVPDGAGGWRRLTGNEIGVLLGDFVLERTTGPDRLVINSVVSSPMLAVIAAHHGASHAVTLTGFKWICNAALALEEQGKRFVFGFEEALGYTIGPVVRDKDGLSAALWFADLAALCAAAGETVLDRLADLRVRHGVWVSHPLSLRRQGPDGIAEITTAMQRLAAAPPDRLGGEQVVAVTDFEQGASSRPSWLPAASLIELRLADGSRAQARPSGTEPKLKIYVDVRGEAASRAAVPEAEAAALSRAAALGADLAATMGL
ncbi:MAG TPA: 5-formyltetrahydrofolate cyclo-ligase [Acidimicrobiia bacterium]|nr:5-formyltetrahydrofolate cyclo-ligase [Acidimicrobiia bacterium]